MLIGTMTSATKHKSEIDALASLLISRFGVRATSYASHQALKARQSGELRRMEAWRRIADATAQVWRTEPELDQPEPLPVL
jgi:hypothetical protein